MTNGLIQYQGYNDLQNILKCTDKTIDKTIKICFPFQFSSVILDATIKCRTFLSYLIYCSKASYEILNYLNYNV